MSAQHRAYRAALTLTATILLAGCGSSGPPAPQSSYDQGMSPQANADHGCLRTHVDPSQCGAQARAYCQSLASLLTDTSDEAVVLSRDLCRRIEGSKPWAPRLVAPGGRTTAILAPT
jgi:hypothetical protein